MLQNLDEIKRIRKKIGIGQKELAKAAGVSQSLIAKIESGKIEPSFSKAQNIFLALEKLGVSGEVRAKELMNKKIVFVKPRQSIKEVVKIMKAKSISQLPVLDSEKVVGLVSEKTIVEKMLEGDVSGLKVDDLMEEAPPIVSLETSRRVVLELLKENPIVLVAEKGKVKGLISKSDLLGRV